MNYNSPCQSIHVKNDLLAFSNLYLILLTSMYMDFTLTDCLFCNYNYICRKQKNTFICYTFGIAVLFDLIRKVNLNFDTSTRFNCKFVSIQAI